MEERGGKKRTGQLSGLNKLNLELKPLGGWFSGQTTRRCASKKMTCLSCATC